jgi:hypothetical protein
MKSEIYATASVFTKFGLEVPAIELDVAAEQPALLRELTPAASTPELEDNLSFEQEVNYTRLQDLLKAQQWEAADSETHSLMLQVVGRDPDDWIRAEELANFPCMILHMIDQLWLQHSQGRFGFSVQEQIWLSLGGQPGQQNKAIWQQFGNRIGWCINSSWLYHDCLTFSLSAPEGHLPSGSWGGAFCCLMIIHFGRLAACRQNES